MSETLYTKYRPEKFEDVIGQDIIVRSLINVLKSRKNQTFLLHGPSGTGKTTLARIAATFIGTAVRDIVEVDAATFTSIDDMRKITETLRYKPTSGKKSTTIIIDECHRLSSAAWSSLLKSLEEPPSWVFWFLCTTELGKVPANIKTRCTTYSLKEVATSEIGNLLAEVASKEKFTCDQSVIELCARQAQGSPRTGLVVLGACAAAKNKAEALELLQSAEESSEAVDLAKMLMMGRGWDDVHEILASLREKDMNPESVRHVVRSYITGVILGSKKQPKESLFAVLEAFSQPFNSSDGFSPLVLACGSLVLK